MLQHQGAGAKTFPLVCIFSGADYTAKADEFEAMLIERGVAELQHPVYGTIKVKPVGHIEREDDPVNKLGESTVSITLTETLTGEAVAELNEVAAADFAAAIEDADMAEQMDITTALETQTQSITESMEPLASSDKKGFAEWLASAKELKDTIKNLYSKAKGIAGKAEGVYAKVLNIGRLTLRLMKLPSDIAISLAEKKRNIPCLPPI
jgi:prophage DNA circulation protein